MNIMLKVISDTRKDKNRVIQEDYVNTSKIKPISPTGVFCSGVYCIIQGMNHTRTVMYGRNVFS